MLGFDYSECRVEGADMVSFHHLVGGYDVAYYSYPWSVNPHTNKKICVADFDFIQLLDVCYRGF